jgi:hypothetical protein
MTRHERTRSMPLQMLSKFGWSTAHHSNVIMTIADVWNMKSNYKYLYYFGQYSLSSPLGCLCDNLYFSYIIIIRYIHI